ncbi:hypothetical protein OH77DRAFT_720285 [Trametes cingulata]|nr:hypothetical protein OH77DRAFT_720285 [Trametes cingulata]
MIVLVLCLTCLACTLFHCSHTMRSHVAFPVVDTAYAPRVCIRDGCRVHRGHHLAMAGGKSVASDGALHRLNGISIRQTQIATIDEQLKLEQPSCLQQHSGRLLSLVQLQLVQPSARQSTGPTTTNRSPHVLYGADPHNTHPELFIDARRPAADPT